jgi:hypothetical protein
MDKAFDVLEMFAQERRLYDGGLIFDSQELTLPDGGEYAVVMLASDAVAGLKAGTTRVGCKDGEIVLIQDVAAGS